MRTSTRGIARDITALRKELDSVRAEVTRYRESLSVEFRHVGDCIEYAIFADGVQDSLWYGVPGIYVD